MARQQADGALAHQCDVFRSVRLAGLQSLDIAIPVARGYLRETTSHRPGRLPSNRIAFILQQRKASRREARIIADLNRPTAARCTPMSGDRKSEIASARPRAEAVIARTIQENERNARFTFIYRFGARFSFAFRPSIISPIIAIGGNKRWTVPLVGRHRRSIRRNLRPPRAQLRLKFCPRRRIELREAGRIPSLIPTDHAHDFWRLPTQTKSRAREDITSFYRVHDVLASRATYRRPRKLRRQAEFARGRDRRGGTRG
jgi:hypothetical protein